MIPCCTTDRGGDRKTAPCVYLPALEDCLGHKDAHFHIHVVLRPAVVLSHCTVVALGVGLEFSLAPESGAQSVKAKCNISLSSKVLALAIADARLKLLLKRLKDST